MSSGRKRTILPGRWHFGEILDADASAQAARIAKALQISSFCARTLVRRGFDSEQSAGDFLSRRMDLLHDPLHIPDMKPAVERIAAAVEKNERILLFGDYDVDGITAVATMARFFRLLRAKTRRTFDIQSRVPERKHGYGLSATAVERILQEKPDLLITLDNGISAHENIARLSQSGIDCIVVDHHHIGATLPPALAVVCAKRTDSGWNYPFHELCGAGLAFKLAWALSVHFSRNTRVAPEFRTFLLDAFALAATGTLADVVPLVGENRIIAHHGLAALGRTQMPGLRALIDICKIEGAPSVADVSFRIAPRINAAGRCAEAATALDLLLCDDPATAANLARKLDQYNADRQTLEQRILDAARTQAAGQVQSQPEARALVLHSEDWHLGVIGIVASRIVEEFHRPAILLSVDPATKIAQGSGRSIRKLHLYEALAQHDKMLRSFGGHSAAAGLTLEAARIDEFRAGFLGTAAAMLSSEDMVPGLRIDEQLALDEITSRLCSDLEAMEPCGPGNPRPVLAILNAALHAPPQFMGKEERHVSFFVRDGNNAKRVVGFNFGEHFNELCKLHGAAIDVAFRPKLNTFRGQTSVELMMEAFRCPPTKSV